MVENWQRESAHVWQVADIGEYSICGLHLIKI